MNKMRKFFAFGVMAAVLSPGLGFAQDHDRDHHDDGDHHDAREHHDHPYVRHDDWHRGTHMRHEDWDRGERIDYRHYHLRRPPSGYEWREVDGNYVMAAVATGVIASVIAASAAHH